MPLRRLALAETLLAFAGLDETRIQEMDPDQLESQVQLALLVWNAVLLADEEAAEAKGRGGDGEAAFEAVIAGLIADIRTSLGASEPGGPDEEQAGAAVEDEDEGESIETLVRYLVVRKLEQHGSDHRAIAEVRVERDGSGGCRVVATGL